MWFHGNAHGIDEFLDLGEVLLLGFKLATIIGVPPVLVRKSGYENRAGRGVKHEGRRKTYRLLPDSGFINSDMVLSAEYIDTVSSSRSCPSPPSLHLFR